MKLEITLSDEPLTVRTLIGASGAYACITKGIWTSDVKLAPGKGARAALIEAATENETRALRLMRSAALWREAAEQI